MPPASPGLTIMGDYSMRISSRAVRAASVVVVLATVAAACSSDKQAATTTAEATTAVATTAAGGSDTTMAGGSDTTAAAGATGCAAGPDTKLDATDGDGAGWMKWALDCAKEKPMKAEGDPIVIGLQNPEGDPNGSFPEYTTAAKAATEFINNELGGVGADYKAGKPGRPIKLEVCSMMISPADSQKCANELAGKKPFAVYSTLNFFGNHFPIYAAAGIPVVVGTPLSPADFTSPGVYAIGGGGGCLGVHTGLIEFMANNLKKKKISVPWADTPPGVFCYNDLEKKPLNVLNGTTKSTSDMAGKIPDLTHIGVAVKPGQADVTPQATQVLDFKPDGIIFSAQGADCWTMVASLAKLGWTSATTPLVLSGSCLDTEKAKAAGDTAKGIYFIGTTPITQPDALEGLLKQEALVYADKMKQYGAGDDVGKGFGTQGFEGMMILFQTASEVSAKNPSFTGKDLGAALAATKNSHSFGGTPLSCSTAPPPYVSVCNSTVTATQWDGEKYNVVAKDFSGLHLIAGTELDLGS